MCPDEHMEDDQEMICFHMRNKRGAGFWQAPGWCGMIGGRKQKAKKMYFVKEFLDFSWNWHFASVSPASRSPKLVPISWKQADNPTLSSDSSS